MVKSIPLWWVRKFNLERVESYFFITDQRQSNFLTQRDPWNETLAFGISTWYPETFHKSSCIICGILVFVIDNLTDDIIISFVVIWSVPSRGIELCSSHPFICSIPVQLMIKLQTLVLGHSDTFSSAAHINIFRKGALAEANLTNNNVYLFHLIHQ